MSVGACAITGGVPAMRNTIGLRECLEAVYLHGASLEGGGMIPNDEDLPLLLDRVYPSHEVVKIDYFLPGCPPSGRRWPATTPTWACPPPKIRSSSPPARSRHCH